MKKLMLTTALAGLMIGGSAIAQTTISGELRIGFKAISVDDEANTSNLTGIADSKRGFGIEHQINFANKGKLNVGGLDYAAGFSIENDGVQTSSLFNENNYIDLINPSTGTTISFSQDHVQRSDTDRSAAVIFGYSPNDLSTNGITSAGNRSASFGVLAGFDNASNTLFDQTAGPGVGQSQSIAVLQKLGNFGTVSYNYAPTLTDKASTTTTGAGSSENLVETNEKSGYEIGFTGSLGVAGLDVALFKSEQKAAVGENTKAKGQHIGVRYSTGPITVGVAQKKYSDNVRLLSTATATTNLTGFLDDEVETKEKHYGISYAVDKNLSVMLLHATAKADDSIYLTTAAVSAPLLRPETQKVTSLQVGYNLGPVALTAGVAKNTDIGGVADQDQKMFFTRLIGAF